MFLLLPYLIKLAIVLTVLYLFYQLVLRRLTFYTWNRWYLLGYSVLAFLLPLINVGPLLQQQNWSNNNVTAWIPAVPVYQQAVVATTTAATITSAGNPVNWYVILLTVLVAGSCILLVRLLIQYWSLHRMRTTASLLSDEEVKIYQVSQPIMPFSFGQSIYVNCHQHSEEELKEIIRHEFVHVQQQHSIDVLWSEILCILNWYNPFAWLIRYAIRQNLEFIADHKVLENGIDKKQYQYLLLKVIGTSSYSIASQFNFSNLKKRIAMMNKMKSAGVHLWKFLFILPLAVVMLVAFRQQSPKAANTQGVVASLRDTVPNKQWPDTLVWIHHNNNKAVVKLKNGTIEEYDLDKPAEKAAYKKKYGNLKLPVAPAPPAAPVAPSAMATPHAAPVPPTPPGPPALPKGVAGIKVREKDNRAIVTLKNGTTETYDLNKPEEKAAYEKKYGELPPPPPLPPSGNEDGGVMIAPGGNTMVMAYGSAYIPASVSNTADNRIEVSAGTIDVGPTAHRFGEVGDPDDLIAVYAFKKQFTREDMEAVKKNMERDGYRVDIKNADFSKGYLSAVEMTVSKDGSSNHIMSADFDGFEIRVVKTKGGGHGLVIRVQNGKLITS